MKTLTTILFTLLMINASAQTLALSRQKEYKYIFKLEKQIQIDTLVLNLLMSGYTDISQGGNFIFCRRNFHQKYFGIGWNEFIFNIRIIEDKRIFYIEISQIIVIDSIGKYPVETLHKRWRKRAEVFILIIMNEIKGCNYG